MIEKTNKKIPVTRQCDLINLSRSSAYYCHHSDSVRDAYEVRLLHEIDALYTAHPNLGREMMTASLRRKGYAVNPKRVRRLMRKLGLFAVYPQPRKNTSRPAKPHKKYPYLLKDMDILEPDLVWCSDITYIRLRRGFVYLVAVLDWFSRYVISWELSNSLDASFCVNALESALRSGRRPTIFNTDRGSQFTSDSFTQPLLASGIKISMDGRGRAFDNIMIERLWRTVKYEDVYLRDYDTPAEARYYLGNYFDYYNHDRPHSRFDGRSPGEIYGIVNAENPLTIGLNNSIIGQAFMLDGTSVVGADVCRIPVALRAPSTRHTSNKETEKIIP